VEADHAWLLGWEEVLELAAAGDAALLIVEEADGGQVRGNLQVLVLLVLLLLELLQVLLVLQLLLVLLPSHWQLHGGVCWGGVCT